MHINPSKIVTIFLRNGVALFFFVTLIGIMISVNFHTILDPYSYDENLYIGISNNFTVDHIKYVYNNVLETKPLTFLVLQKTLNSGDPIFTRGFAYLLIVLCTILIYKITNNKLAFLYVLIPIFLDSMWLTAEIIEVFFVLLSIQYVNRGGLFIGLATIFRPTSILYSVLLQKKQILYVFGIGTIFAMVLLALGLFFPYLHEVMSYAGDGFSGFDLLLLVILVMLVIMGVTNKKMFPYVVISAVPLYMELFPHYFLPVYSFLYVGYLLNMNDDLREIRA